MGSHRAEQPGIISWKVKNGPDAISSPFSLVLAPYGARLPAEFRTQFLHPAEAPAPLRLHGLMQRIGHRPRWLGPLFWMLARLGLLVAENGHNVPTEVLVTAGREASGLPFHHYARTFHFPRGARYFEATTVYDPRRGQAADWAGRGRLVYIVWDFEFQPPDTLVTRTAACALGLGPVRLWVPRGLLPWLFMDGLTVQRADPLDPDRFHLAFSLLHPWLGEVFAYEGEFRTLMERA